MGLRGLIEGAIQDLVRRIQTTPETFMRAYARHAIVREVLEVDVSSKHRMLAQWDAGVLRLLEVGGHESVPRYTSSKFFVDAFQSLDVPRRFWPADHAGYSFFTSNPSREYQEFGPESHEGWLYFLSEQQWECEQEVIESFDLLFDGLQPAPVFILGGPGTGKTSILLNLLKDCFDFELKVGITMSWELAKYSEACMPQLDLSEYVVQGYGGLGRDVLLVDDPKSFDELMTQLQIAKDNQPCLLVAAFDPCQLKENLPDDAFAGLVRQNKIDVHGLDSCYRQKENVGLAVKKVVDTIASSTPFLADRKIEDFRSRHLHLTGVANELSFPNLHGYVETHIDSTTGEVAQEVKRIRSKPLWRHWPPLLVVVDDERSLSDAAMHIIKVVDHRVVKLSDIESIKGLEFQHAFIFIQKQLFNQLELGFEGTGQSLYNKRRLLRIPFSRSKDSLVTFVIQ